MQSTALINRHIRHKAWLSCLLVRPVLNDACSCIIIEHREGSTCQSSLSFGAYLNELNYMSEQNQRFVADVVYSVTLGSVRFFTEAVQVVVGSSVIYDVCINFVLKCGSLHIQICPEVERAVINSVGTSE